jgi:formylglycine-generating enzyme required for sulfatase activity
VPIDDQRQLQIIGKRQLGSTPLRIAELAPGGYLLMIRPKDAPDDSSAVRYPLLVERGETLKLSLVLPPANTVPRGFVYIPAGRAPFGSDANNSERRDFLYHVPLHTVHTEGFLIARHETTYADWIDFLRHQDESERPKWLLRAGQAGDSGSLELRELPGGFFELSLQSAKAAYRVREGELLRFATDKRRPIDWRTLPVTGVSIADAEAYLGWLRDSGRLAGARLCSEREWERAARGADDRHYPHGDRLQPSDAAFDQTYGQDPLAMGPDLVGSHPASRSLFGVDDLAGNAFEWVKNGVSNKAYALRGGAYYYGGRTCRLDNRHEAQEALRDATVGLRVCATIRVN